MRYPQCSFDSGFITLGSMFSKGPLALKMVKSNVLFTIDIYSFLSTGDLGCQNVTSHFQSSLVFDLESNNTGIPALKLTFSNVDKIELTPIYDVSSVGGSTGSVISSASLPIIPLLSGDCQIYLSDSIVDFFLNNEGSMSILYLLWGYCNIFPLPKRNEGISEDLTVNENIECLLSCVKSVLKLLINVLKISGEIREQFLQEHGYVDLN